MTSRRSSFFCRQLLHSVLDNSNCDNESTPSLSSQDEKIILRHVEEIERTISDWRIEYVRTKAKYKESVRNQDQLNVVECKDALLPEDIEFLNNRFDYAASIRKLEDLISKMELTKLVAHKRKANLNEQVKKLERVYTDIEQKIGEYLLECDEAADLFST